MLSPRAVCLAFLGSLAQGDTFYLKPALLLEAVCEFWKVPWAAVVPESGEASRRSPEVALIPDAPQRHWGLSPILVDSEALVGKLLGTNEDRQTCSGEKRGPKEAQLNDDT